MLNLEKPKYSKVGYFTILEFYDFGTCDLKFSVYYKIHKSN